MFTYKAAYKYVEDGWVFGQVLDFPGAISQGRDLNDAREMLAGALAGVAETLALRGQPLPLPDPTAEPDQEMDREEDIHLALTAGCRLSIDSRPLSGAAVLPDRAAVREGDPVRAAA